MPQTPPEAIITPMMLVEKIISAACTYYKITEVELKKRENTDQRKIVLYLLREKAMAKYSKIAKRFGYSDHAWTSRQIAEIESQKDIYAHISHDIKNIMDIVGTLM